MEGGEIKNNTANRGGGIALIGSEMTMSGGHNFGKCRKINAGHDSRHLRRRYLYLG